MQGAFWHCYRIKILEKVQKRLQRKNIHFIVEQTKDRGAGTKGSGYPVKVWIVHVPDMEQDRLAEILKEEARWKKKRFIEIMK